MKESIKAVIWTLIFLVLFGYFEVFGLYHTFTKHKDEIIIALVLPPFAWYRAVEFWWHDDFAGVDWEKRLEYDSKTCVGIVNAVIRQRQGEELETSPILGQTIDEFSQQVGTYPKEKREYLKNLTKNYILYSESMMLDFQKCFSEMADLKKSVTTTKYETNLKKYPFMVELIAGIDRIVYEQFEGMNVDSLMAIKSQEELKMIILNLEAYFNIMQNTMRSAYKDIFNEEFKE